MATALVTGANRGLGLALVRKLLGNGWKVIATSRSPEKSTALNELAKTSPKLEVLPLDVNSAGAIIDLASKLKDTPIDLLLCNAGTSPQPTKHAKITGNKGERVQDFDDATWLDIFRTNMIGPLRIAANLHENVEASDRKIIAFISTRMANIEENAAGAYYFYRSSKGALNTAIRNLSIELGPKGVACVALHPGWVRTDMGGPKADVTPEDSAAGLVNVLEKVTASDNGKFFDYQGQQVKF